MNSLDSRHGTKRSWINWQYMTSDRTLNSSVLTTEIPGDKCVVEGIKC